MKTALKLSLILNLGLFGRLIFNWVEADGEFSPAKKQVATSVPAVAMDTAPLRVPPATETPSFRWSQLDATDYHMYVKNLRTIGCPEATVRAIAHSRMSMRPTMSGRRR